MYELETRIAGTPAALEQAGTYLVDVLAPGIDALADVAVHQRSVLEQGWQGASGVAFRDAAGELATAGDRMAGLARQVGARLDGLGVALATAQSRMADLRARARSEGLVVREQKVLSPALDGVNGLGADRDVLFTHYAEARITRDEVLANWHARLAEEVAEIQADSAYVQGFTEDLLVDGASAALLGVHAPRMTGHAQLWTDRALAEAQAYAGWAGPPTGAGMPNLKAPVANVRDGDGRPRKVPGVGLVTFGNDVATGLSSGESPEQALVSASGATVAAVVVTRVLPYFIPGVGPLAGTLIGAGGGIVAAKWTGAAIDNHYALDGDRPSTPPPPTPRPTHVIRTEGRAPNEERMLEESGPFGPWDGPAPGKVS